MDAQAQELKSGGEEAWKDGKLAASTERAGSHEETPSEARSSIGAVKTGWYVGKFLGIRKHKAAELAAAAEIAEASNRKVSVDNDGWKELGVDNKPNESDQPTASSSSSWFSFMSKKSTEADREAEAQETEKEEKKNEKTMVSMVRKIRNKLVERKLDGVIHIRRVFGVVSAALTCRVNASSGDLRIEELDDEELPFQCRRAVTSTDIILDSLERRALGWDGVDFNDEMLLTRGLQLGVSDPFFGMIGWSLQVDVSATVRSLLTSRKRFDLMRARSVSESSFRFSFSFSGKSNSKLPDLSLPPLNADPGQLRDSDVSETSDSTPDQTS